MKLIRTVALSSAIALMSNASSAGIYSDLLGKCLVDHTAQSDKEALVLWMLVAFASNPNASSVVELKPTALTKTAVKMAEIFERLVLVDCLDETLDANKNEGDIAFELAFGILGQVAGQQAFENKAVEAAALDFMNYVDQERFERVLGDK